MPDQALLARRLLPSASREHPLQRAKLLLRPASPRLFGSQRHKLSESFRWPEVRPYLLSIPRGRIAAFAAGLTRERTGSIDGFICHALGPVENQS
jgi:hypothetical protein